MTSFLGNVEEGSTGGMFSIVQPSPPRRKLTNNVRRDILVNSERVHPAFGQRRWRTRDVGTHVGKDGMFDVGKYSPVWFGYTQVERDSKL